jgi:hypothetical protein
MPPNIKTNDDLKALCKRIGRSGVQSQEEFQAELIRLDIPLKATVIYDNRNDYCWGSIFGLDGTYISF